MTYRQYLKEHSIWLKGMLCLVVSTEIFMLTLKRSIFVMGFLFAAAMICFLVCSFVEYRKMKQYVEELVSNAEAISEKYLLYEMIEREETQEQRHLKEIFYGIETETVSKIETLRRENTEYREFVETWVHEMKVPIAVIKMILANHKEADIGISAETERIEQYVEQALFYARSTAAEKDYLVNSVNLQKLAEQVILAHKRQLREMNAKIDLHDLDRDVYSDSKWLLFMVGQVVDNSIKYCTGNGTLVLEMYATESANTVCLHLKDNVIDAEQSEASISAYIAVGDYCAATTSRKKATDEWLNALASDILNSQQVNAELTVGTKIAIRESNNGLAMMVSFLVVYMGVMFMLASAAILSLKTLSDTVDSVERFQILRKLGCDRPMMKKALSIQVGSFFLAPVVIALIHSIFGIRFAGVLLKGVLRTDLKVGILMTAVFMVIFYGSYMIAAMRSSKRIVNLDKET